MKCIKCGETDISQFSPSRLKASDYRCKKCYNLYNHKYYREHPEVKGYLLAHQHTYYNNLKTLVLSHYCKGEIVCAVCGETDNLSIDHINGNGAKHREELGFNNSYQFYSWLKRNNYPAGYRVLCGSCNSSIRANKQKQIHQKTSKLLLQYIEGEVIRAKEILNWGRHFNLSQHAVSVTLYRLIKEGKIKRISRGVYTA